ncbi:MAG: PD40 domain-containing protein [Verrucomicrobia bacterium]|nr:PD40 domain-containing protein [Verrucomicrobiota bacterium]
MKAPSNSLNPFPGLRSFRSDEDYLFFGREEQTMELLARLQRNRFVAVVGTSGRGKSSLVRCGLLSRLQGGSMLEAGAHWEIAVMHPGGDPLTHLAEAMLEAGLYDPQLENALPNLIATLGRSQFGLIEAVRQAGVPRGTNFLLVVDQFEEIFRFEEAGAAESELANDFIAMLREAAAQTELPIYVVTTMRSDFIGDCSRFEGLAEAVNRGEYLIPRLTREQFKSVIEGPIRVGGGRITPRLLQRLLNDLGEEQDQLPCLQHALMRTWNVWRERPGAGELDLEDYQRVGKMSQALSIHADEVYFGLASDRQRQLGAAAFKALTVEGSEKRGVRRPRRVDALCRILDVDKAELIPVIDAFRQTGVTLLMPAAGIELRDTTIVDLSHESLMRVWARLRDWVDEEAKSVGIFRRLSESAALWQQGKAGLYRDPDLSVARCWLEQTRPNTAWAGQYDGNFDDAVAFLERSREAVEEETRAKEAAQRRELEQAKALAEAERRRAGEQASFAARLKWLVRGLGLVAMFALTAMLLAIAARKEAQQNAELARQNETRATEHARIATAEKKRADAQAEKFRNQVYKVQLLRADTALRQFNGGSAFTYLQECEESLRHWEWKRLVYRSDQSLKTFKTTTGYIAQLQYSLDGRHLMGTSYSVFGLKVWEVATGDKIWETTDPAGGRVFGASVPFAYSSDGKRIAVRNRTRIEIWDATSRQKLSEVRNVPGHFELRFTPDGEALLAAHGEDRTLKLWDVATGQVRKSFVGHLGPLVAAAFAPDGRTIASGGIGGTIRIWDTEATSPRQVVPSQRSWISALGFSPDGQRLASGDREGSVRIHDVSTGREIKIVDDRFKGEIRSITFNPDGRLLAAAGGSTIKLWDTEAYDELALFLGYDGDIGSIAFAPDGRTLVSGGVGGVVKFWSSGQASDVHALRGHSGALREVAFSPDGSRLASSGFDGTIRIWNVATGQEILTLKGHRGPAVAVAFSPDGRQIASGANLDYSVRLWDAATGTPTKTLSGHSNPVWWVAFSPDGKLVASGGVGGEAKLWDTKTGKELRTFKAADASIEGIRFSPDGKTIATCGAALDGQVKIWNVTSGELLKKFRGPEGYHRCVVFSPDGRSVAVGTVPNAMIWDLASGESRTLNAQGGRIQTLAFSPDGKRLFGAGERGIISVWDITSGDEILTMDGEQANIWSVQVSPDGRTLASSGVNGVIRLWETVRPAEDVSRKRRLVNSARRIVDERAKIIPFASDLIASLREDAALQPAVRDMAIQIAETRGDDPNALLASCQAILRNPDADPISLQLALRQMETAAAILTDDVVINWMLGFARLRAGKLAEALNAADRSNQLAQEQFKTDSAAALMVQAMAHFRLGATERASLIYAQAQALPPSNVAPPADLRLVAQLAERVFR